MFENWKIWMVLLMVFATVGLLVLAGCGTKIELKDCDNSLVIIEQSSEQRTDNKPNIPIDLSKATAAVKELAGLPDISKLPVVVPIKKPDQPEKPDVIEPKPLPGLDKKLIESAKMIPYEDKAGAWLSRPGKDYKGPLRIVFNNGCGVLDVPDPVVGVFITREQAVFFPHDPKKPNNMHGAALIHTRKGCVSTKAEIYQL